MATENYLAECDDDELMALAMSLRSSLQAIKREQFKRIYGGGHPVFHPPGLQQSHPEPLATPIRSPHLVVVKD